MRDYCVDCKYHSSMDGMERFELYPSSIISNPQYCIVDTKNNEIYNDLGSVYFSSAPALCELLNEQNKEIEKYKEWEKWVKDVNREEVDRIFHMSIREIADAFEYYKERIKKLEYEMEFFRGLNGKY